MTRHCRKLTKTRIPARAADGVEATVGADTTLALKLTMLEMAIETGVVMFRNAFMNGAI